MIAMLAVAAYAVPPRGEVVLGWSGNADQGNAVATFQPALLRTSDASFVLRATVSEQYYGFPDQGLIHRVESPGISVGPGFVYTPGNFVLGMAVGLEARRSTRRLGTAPATRTLDLDASLAGEAAWRPGTTGAIYSLFSFSAANKYLWIRAGATHPLIPWSAAGTAASLWLGVEGTTRGNRDSRVFEVGPVVEVPIRDLNASFSVRGGVAMQEVRGELVQQGTLGFGMYWAF